MSLVEGLGRLRYSAAFDGFIAGSVLVREPPSQLAGCLGDALRAGVSVVIDGLLIAHPEYEPLTDGAQVYFGPHTAEEVLTDRC